MEDTKSSWTEQKKTGKFTLTNEQHRAVTIQENTVVVAGAGSGKTTVLALRVLYLLIEKRVNISEILVLTFSRKACAEMSARIRAKLVETIETRCFLERQLGSEDLEFLQIQLQQYHNAQISTIDSFCLRIARIAATREGNFEIPQISLRYEAELSDFAQRWIFSHKEGIWLELLSATNFTTLLQKYILPVFSKLNAEKFHKLFDFNEIYRKCRTKVLNALQKTRKHVAIKTKNLLHQFNLMEDELSINSSFQKKFFHLKKIHDLLEKQGPFPEEGEELKENLEALKGRLPRTITVEIKLMLEKIRDELKDYIELCATPLNEDAVPENYKKLYMALEALAEAWIQYRKDNNIYFHNDIANSAYFALEKHRDLRQWFSSNFTHVIVDEAQDNNFNQKHFLYNLSHYADIDNEQESPGSSVNAPKHHIQKQKFYFVGDPQQSIYAFRGAEVQSFADMEKEMEDTIYLTYNYRSSEKLVAFFNAAFSLLFNEPALAALYNPTNIRYQLQQNSTTTEKIKETENNKNAVSPVSLHILDKNVKELNFSIKELEAFYIVRKIADMVAKKQASFDDIAILCRTKDLFPFLLKHCTMQGIPHSVEEQVLGLRIDMGIDFYSWFSLLLYPEDRAAYAAVLRGPLARISDASVLQLLMETGALFCPEEETQKDIDKEDLLHLNELRKQYQNARKLLKEKTLLDVLDHFWLSCGYRYLLLQSISFHSYLDMYYVLRSLLQQEFELGTVQAHATLRYFLEGRTEIQGTSPAKNGIEQGKGVRIMTIHAAKGLEFPVVIVAGLGKKFHSKKQSKAILTQDMALFDLPDYFLQSEKNKKQGHPLLLSKNTKRTRKNDLLSSAYSCYNMESELGEELRILYVAMTRAKKRLLLCGVNTKKQKPEEEAEPKKQSYFDYLHNLLPAVFSEHPVEQLLCTKLEQELEQSITQKKETSYFQNLSNAEKNSRKTDRVSKVIQITPSKSPYYTPEKKYEKNRHLPVLECESILRKYKIYSEFGTYCHALISEHVSKRRRPPEVFNRDLARALNPLNEHEKKMFISTAQRLAHQFYESELNNSFSPNAKKTSELLYLQWDQNSELWIKGTIDLLIIDGEKFCVVDFKVDAYKSPEKYARQISAYRLAVQRMYAIKNITSIDCYLFYLRDASLYKIDTAINENALLTGLEDLTAQPPAF